MPNIGPMTLPLSPFIEKRPNTSRLISFLIVVLSGLSLSAQDFSGKIFDISGTPISDAYLLNLSNESHAHTDEEGFFLLYRAKAGDSISISHLGFRSTIIVLSEETLYYEVFLREETLILEEVLVEPRLTFSTYVDQIEMNRNTLNNAQELLPLVPGLFIGQHAGGGKAEQIFLRGYDIDHGTDVSIQADGMPVNMVSHAHGQGYADLHFLIPEIIERIEFNKGPYSELGGNFATAGRIQFQTKDRIDNSLVRVEMGQFNTFRLLGLANISLKGEQSAYIASDLYYTDGPFESPMNLGRWNILGNYVHDKSRLGRIRVLLSHFTSSWDASGQIPHRAVNQGMISRFGAIDDTEGGKTSRTNISIQQRKDLERNWNMRSQLYYSNYTFDLFSNFTFWLEDSIYGDQIRQREQRDILGGSADFHYQFTLRGWESDFSVGLDFRSDLIKGSELSKSQYRDLFLGYTSLGNLNELQIGNYYSLRARNKRWSTQFVLRYDWHRFKHVNLLSTGIPDTSFSADMLNPKFTLIYDVNSDWQVYLKAGQGYHSNDTRSALGGQALTPLAAARGFDIGFLWRKSNKVFLQATYWQLYSQDELVYVGDVGIVESAGRSFRQGIDFFVRYEPIKRVYVSFDLNLARPRLIDEEEGENYIPLAPPVTAVAGFGYAWSRGMALSLNLRHMAERPANEDNSIVTSPYTILDLNFRYFYKQFEFGLGVKNLLNSEWEETQFATLSRLQNEAEGVEEIHFTPGNPFALKLSVQYTFEGKDAHGRKAPHAH
jgi:outer membrane receptor protein involved in Fe transport